jgi:protein-S-isoprenylcysteine O-methyltransferase Ste14
MDSHAETPFRIAVGILMVLFSVTRTYFQRQVGGVEKVSRRHERRDTFLYNLVMASYLPMILYVFAPWLDFAHLPVPVWLRWLGGATACAGTVLFGWSHRTFGKNWSGILELHEGHVLVAEGPYRYVRRPMYSAFFVTAIGLFLLSANWLIGVLPVAAVTWMYSARVLSEEEMMIEQFGDAYRQYMKKTGRLWPRWSR